MDNCVQCLANSTGISDRVYVGWLACVMRVTGDNDVKVSLTSW